VGHASGCSETLVQTSTDHSIRGLRHHLPYNPDTHEGNLQSKTQFLLLTKRLLHSEYFKVRSLTQGRRRKAIEISKKNFQTILIAVVLYPLNKQIGHQ
jgi:hypothetical protein